MFELDDWVTQVTSKYIRENFIITAPIYMYKFG
jgi:hypothetical protein